jgi:hypothetical protein
MLEDGTDRTQYLVYDNRQRRHAECSHHGDEPDAACRGLERMKAERSAGWQWRAD